MKKLIGTISLSLFLSSGLTACDKVENNYTSINLHEAFAAQDKCWGQNYNEFVTATPDGVNTSFHILEADYEISHGALLYFGREGELLEEKYESVKFDMDATLNNGDFFIVLMSFNKEDGTSTNTDIRVGIAKSDEKLYVAFGDDTGTGPSAFGITYTNQELTYQGIVDVNREISSFDEIKFDFNPSFTEGTISAGGETSTSNIDREETAELRALWMLGNIETAKITNLQVK